MINKINKYKVLIAILCLITLLTGCTGSNKKISPEPKDQGNVVVTPTPTLESKPTPAPVVDPKVIPIPESTLPKEVIETSAATQEPAVQATPTQQQEERKAVTVYITKTGTKYHSEGCSYLSKSKISISLQDAKRKGLGPCSKCNPPQ